MERGGRKGEEEEEEAERKRRNLGEEQRLLWKVSGTRQVNTGTLGVAQPPNLGPSPEPALR